MQKILLLLAGSLALGLSGHPDACFRILGGLTKEWEEINQRQLRAAIKNLHRSHPIDYKEDANGNASLLLTERADKERFILNE